MLIDKTYFVRDTFVAQLGQLEVQENLTSYISHNEPEYLNAVLGVSFNTAFQAGLAILPIPEQRWTDLKLGVVYTDLEGQDCIWEGFAPASKTSPIAMYVYYWLMRSDASWTTGSGEVRPKLQNGERHPSVYKMVLAWNNMVDINHSLLHYLNSKKDLYPEWKPVEMLWLWGEFCWPAWWISYSVRGYSRTSLFEKINSFNL